MHRQIHYIKETLAVISSQTLHSKQFLVELYELLSEFFPIDTLHVPTYDSTTGVFTYKAFVVNKKPILLNEMFTLTGEAGKAVDEIKKKRILIINNSNERPYAKEIANYFSVKAIISAVALTIPTSVSRYAGLSFAAYGENRYQPGHVDLIHHIADPLGNALLRLLDLLEVDCQRKNELSGGLEIRNLLEHQRIDLALNSQDGLRQILQQVEQVAPLDSPVLITGETGVGKELVANSLHGASKRSKGPFIAVNCGAIPESLLDSELFGFEKGAFTGADGKKVGYFELADKGSLFLDEIGELSLQAQTKLLRVLQNKTIQRVGGGEPIPVDVRVIAATNRNLSRMMKERRFRQDLWYRLNVFPINVPPLRERKRDIPALVQYLINNKLFEMNLPFQPRLSPRAMDQLIAYDWPGNVRELQNILERALILCKGKPMSFENLVSVEPYTEDHSDSHPSDGFPSMEEMMIRHINQSLIRSNGKIDGPGGAAELLKMNPSTLRARMKKLNISINRTPLQGSTIIGPSTANRIN
ncbi:MAG: sigma-54 interaction domain-containing protein [Thermodesulfobacteriota bacterium]